MSSSRGSQPTRSWIAVSAGMRLGPGNFPARPSTPGARAGASAIGAAVSRGDDPPYPPRRARWKVECIGHAFDLHRAELELRDLSEGVDLIDGEQVSGRLPEVERDEAVARGLPVRHLHLKLDAAPAGR